MSRQDDRSRRRVARYVAVRRAELGLSQEDLATAAGINPKTVLELEQAKRWPQPKTRQKLEPALGWDEGDLNRIAEGGFPRTGPLLEDDPDGLIAAAAATAAGEATETEFDLQVRRVISELPPEYRGFVEEMYEMLQDSERQNRRLRRRIVPMPPRDGDAARGDGDRESGSQRLPNS